MQLANYGVCRYKLTDQLKDIRDRDVEFNDMCVTVVWGDTLV